MRNDGPDYRCDSLPCETLLKSRRGKKCVEMMKCMHMSNFIQYCIFSVNSVINTSQEKYYYKKLRQPKLLGPMKATFVWECCLISITYQQQQPQRHSHKKISISIKKKHTPRQQAPLLFRIKQQQECEMRSSLGIMAT